MWRPATRVTGTNDIPVGGKRRFGLPEEAPPPSAPPIFSRAPEDIKYFNGRLERDRDEKPNVAAPPPPPPRDDYRRDDYRRDDRDARYDDRRRDDYRRDERDDRYREREGDRYDRDRQDAGAKRRWDEDGPRGGGGGGGERGRDPAPVQDQPRKRKSRWGDESQKTDVPGLPVAVMGNVSQKELDNYAIHVRLEEINRKLRTGDVIPPDGQRSPSPTPAYDAYGRRTNTRDLRYRQRLEDERVKLIDRAMKADPGFRPPIDFGGNRNKFGRPQEKVYIPVKEFPEINFFGLLVGPRGNSLKRMERESGAKISIRGKGSVKEGKGRPDAWAADEEDELHCLVTADHEHAVKACVNLINKVIETAASTPEGQNDHKRNQLRELASLNGTLRDDENQLCQNCGEKGHRRWECPQQRVYSANVICRLCGGAGHMARDCRGRGDPNLAKNSQNAFDSEYTALMAELGEGSTAGARPAGAITQPQQQVPPWRIPENWLANARPPYMGPPGGGPPQGYGGGYAPPGGYGYGQQDNGYPQQAGPAGGAPGGADPYASYYQNMGQPQAA